ncbi:MAG: hypothetical protein Q9198_005285, partial [Flavoplaca austrocitrina]
MIGQKEVRLILGGYSALDSLEEPLSPVVIIRTYQIESSLFVVPNRFNGSGETKWPGLILEVGRTVSARSWESSTIIFDFGTCSDCYQSSTMPPPSEISNRSELGHVMSTPDDPIVIDTQGDLLLDVHYSKDLIQYYRVSVSVLRKQSSYFHNLLSTSFSEGTKVDSRLATLRNCQKDIACVPPSALPTVTISDIAIGPADAQTNICEASFGLLLEVLHGRLQWSILKTKGYVRPIILAMLAHYAEAFAAIPAVSKEINALSEKGYIRGNARPTKDVKEDKSRQKIYAGLILDLPEWVQTHSAALIIWGSKSWVGETERSIGVDTAEYPWDYLSGGVE